MTSGFSFSAKKSLGQNYLKDPNIIRKIVASSPIESGDHILEVGPGPGALTRQLIDSKAAHVTTIEKDSQFIPQWSEVAENTPKFHIIHGDALKIRLQDIGSERPLRIIANLPYNVGTQLILNWLEELPLVHSMTLMLQKEVVMRLVAEPGTKDYGRLAILTQWLCETKRLFDVPKTAFKPQPKVTSAIVQIIPRAAPLFPAKKEFLERITAAAFQQRRKMIKKSLKPLFDNVEEMLTSLGIAPMARPEVLTLENFCALARVLERE